MEEFDLPQIIDRNNNISCLSIQLLPEGLSQRPSAQICWSRLQSHLGDENSTALFGGLFILLNHSVDPWCFTSYIEVMCTGFGACPYCVLSMSAIRADSCNHDKCLFRQRTHFGVAIHSRRFNCYSRVVNSALQKHHIVVLAGTNSCRRTWRVSVRVQLLAIINDCLELWFRTTSNGPFQIDWEVDSNVLGC